MKKTLSNTTYLYGVRALHEEKNYCRAVDLAKHINITPGSCSTGIKSLIKKGMLTYDDNKFLFLTKEAKLILKKLDKNIEIFNQFLFMNSGLKFDDVPDLTKGFIHLVPQKLIDAL